ncbi:unnamed protein product, partial [Meganyctiphanes norvegica]
MPDNVGVAREVFLKWEIFPCRWFMFMNHNGKHNVFTRLVYGVSSCVDTTVYYHIGTDDVERGMSQSMITLWGRKNYWGLGKIEDLITRADIKCLTSESHSMIPEWFRNCNMIPIWNEVSVENTEGNRYRSVLRLSSVTFSSSGTYTCQPPANTQSAYQRLHITRASSFNCIGCFGVKKRTNRNPKL